VKSLAKQLSAGTDESPRSEERDTGLDIEGKDTVLEAEDELESEIKEEEGEDDVEAAADEDAEEDDSTKNEEDGEEDGGIVVEADAEAETDEDEDGEEISGRPTSSFFTTGANK